jgi:TolB-like protein
MNLSGDPEQEYFADGLAEELLNLLAKVPGLKVAGRTSSFAFRGRNEDLRAIGQTLNVSTVLEGSVQRSGERLRINTQLIDTADGFHLWSERYDREISDVFAVQDEIARAVTAALKVKLLPGVVAPAKQPATNPQAYSQVLLGRYLLLRGTPESYWMALQAFERAVELDPSHAPAWAAMAMAMFYALDCSKSPFLEDHRGNLARALATADKAIELGPDLPDGYTSRGFLRQVKTGDWKGAEGDFARALALRPGDVDATVYQGDLLATLGRLPEAIAVIQKALDMDPLSVEAWWRLALIQLGSGSLEQARETAKRTVELFPEHGHAGRTLGLVLLLEGRYDEAEAAFSRTRPHFREMGVALVEHGRGNRTKSREALERVIASWPDDMTYQIAEICAFCGDGDGAFQWLDRAIENLDCGRRYLTYDRLLLDLRRDARFPALLKKMGLPLRPAEKEDS